jgi:hypothetical protein
MNPEQIQKWLLEHAADICAFTEYEIDFHTEQALAQNLGLYWFRDSRWNQPGMACYFSEACESSGLRRACYPR